MNNLALTLLYIYFILILIILPLFCKTKIFSPLSSITNEENINIENFKSKYRKYESVGYLYDLNITTSNEYHLKNLKTYNLEHLIIVISTFPQYYTTDERSKYSLTQLVTELDVNIRRESQVTTAMLICNQTKQAFRELDNLAQFYPVFNVESKMNSKPSNLEETQKMNFVECVDMGLQEIGYEPRYLTVLRDTVVPYANFLSTLHFILHSKIDNHIQRGDLYPVDDQWLFLQLHEPVTFRSFGFNWASIRELFLVSILGYTAFGLCGKFLKLTNSSRFGQTSSVIFSLYGVLVFLTLALMVGRPYLTELRRSLPYFYLVYPQPEPIYISAVTLPRGSAFSMLTYLTKIKCSIYVPFRDVWDHAITTLDKQGYITSPSLIRYVAES